MSNLSVGTIATSAFNILNEKDKTNKMEYFAFKKYQMAVYDEFIKQNVNNQSKMKDFLNEVRNKRSKEELSEYFDLVEENDKLYLKMKKDIDLMFLREWFFEGLNREEYDLLNSENAREKLVQKDKTRTRK